MNIILASASPRRKEILQNIGLKFDVIKSEIDENILENELAHQLVMRLALEKGIDIASDNRDSLIISADTVVVYNDIILGKPKDKEDAKKMLKMLSGKTHQVITGIALISMDTNNKIIDYVTSNVTFKELSDTYIENYVNTNESLDKAGAYGIQGFGALLVKEIKGDYLNIVGLPVSKLSDLLNEYFDINVFVEGDLSE